MPNLLQETVEDLANYGLSPDDVAFIGFKNGRMTWDVFAEAAARADYDAGFGAQEVATDLVIYGANWTMNRHEYNGCEHWEFHGRPDRIPNVFISPDPGDLKLHVGDDDHLVGWCDLNELNPNLT